MAEDTSTFELRWPWSASATFVGIMWITYVWSVWVAGGTSADRGGIGLGGLTGMGYFVAGAVDPNAIVRDREWERCVSGIFLHGGLLHILLNSGAILQLGRILEAFTTRGRCWFTLMLAGLAGSFAVVIWAQVTRTNVVAVGASGAGCGIGTALIVLSHGVHALTEFRKQMITWVAVMLLMGLIPIISATAHVGGAIGGVLAGLILRRRGFVRIGNDPFAHRLGSATKVLTFLFAAALVLNAWRANERKAALGELDESAEEVYAWLNAGKIPPLDEWRARLDEMELPSKLVLERNALLDLVAELEKQPGGEIDSQTAVEARARLERIRRR